MTNETLQGGAKAFKCLIDDIRTLSNETVDPDSDTDTRDYLMMFSAVSKNIDANITHAARAHREGFIRSLTDLLGMVADGVLPSDDWDPIESTANAFKSDTAPMREMPKAAQLLTESDSVTRLELACAAAADIEVLTNMLKREMNRDDDWGVARLTDISIKKIHSLNSVILSVLCHDDLRSTEELQEAIYGK